MRKKYLLLGLGIVGASLIGCFYYSFDPISTRWMPKCPFKLLTGYDCPACGNQRVLHALLHGEFSVAFHHNPFLVLLSPYLILLVLSMKSQTGTMGKIRAIVQHPIAVYTYVIAICIWWVPRNIVPY